MTSYSPTTVAQVSPAGLAPLRVWALSSDSPAVPILNLARRSPSNDGKPCRAESEQ